MKRDPDHDKPDFLRSTSPHFLDFRPDEAWVDLSAWGPWVLRHAEEIRRDVRNSGVQPLSGLRVPFNEEKGLFGEVFHALVICQREPRPTKALADCPKCGCNVKATGNFHNPTLIVPRRQASTSRYHLVSVDALNWLRNEPAPWYHNHIPPPKVTHVWHITKVEMVNLGRENAKYDERTFVYWYKGNTKHKHWVVNWAQKEVDPRWRPPGVQPPPPEPAPEPIIASPSEAQGYLEQMRRLLE